mmetsp:Transcript_25534/g.59453  ORF Transcript_25534/g.59453 Transcript_25534/m.59453 type:complete len:428 (+) Transcript_25534:63-1346(+)
MPPKKTGGAVPAKSGPKKKQPVVHSRCVQVHVNDVCKEAINIFSGKSAQGEIPLVLIPSSRPTFSMYMEVPSGVTCLMQRFGKDIGPAEPGLKLFYPSYYRIAYVVTRQSCTYDAPVRACPTADDVRVSVDVVLVFSIRDASAFIYKLGATNFDDYLSGTVDEAIRVMVRRETHETVYSLRGERAGQMLSMLNAKFEDCGVSFTDVKITAVWLPESLAGYLETATQLEKQMQKIDRQTEFEILQIKQESEMQIEETKRKTEQVLVTENGRKKRAEMEFEQRSVKAEEVGRVALIKAEQAGETRRKQLEGRLQRTKTELETEHVTEVARAKADCTVKKEKADLKAEQMTIQAATEEEKMVCDAEATKYEASAEKEAQKSLQAKRKHDLELREKTILAKMAEAGQFNIVGSQGDRLVDAMMNGQLSSSK